jgi:hypothetical protein
MAGKNGQGQVAEELLTTGTRKKKPVRPGPRRPVVKGGAKRPAITVGNYRRLMGWEQIAEYFPVGRATVCNKYAQEMLAAGYVFKSVINDDQGHRKWRVWTYDFLVVSFISQKQAAQGFI